MYYKTKKIKKEGLDLQQPAATAALPLPVPVFATAKYEDIFIEVNTFD